MIEFFERLRIQNWHFSYFLRHCFVFLHNAIKMSISWLFRICFHTKIFSKCNFRTHYNVGSSTALIESLKFRNNPWITVTSPSNLLWKLWILVFWILCFVTIVFLTLSGVETLKYPPFHDTIFIFFCLISNLFFLSKICHQACFKYWY